MPPLFHAFSFYFFPSHWPKYKKKRTKNIFPIREKKNLKKFLSYIYRIGNDMIKFFEIPWYQMNSCGQKIE